MKSVYRNLMLGLLSLGMLTQCSIAPDAEAPAPSANAKAKVAGATSLAAATGLATVAPCKVGAAVNVSLMKSTANYRNLVLAEYNSVTAENAMKMAINHPSQGTYNWADGDWLVNFALTNSIRVHGHTLIWHNEPGWVTNFVGTTAQWEDLMKTHIQTVVAHYKGKVVSWDVVNEAVANDGTMRNTVWLQHLGRGYVARAFTYAHQADPAALLFYNDYGHEYNNVTKRDSIFALINRLKAQGIPIHGIGMQMHTNSSQALSTVVTAINMAVATGLRVHISELDINMNPNGTATTYTQAIADAQKNKYKLFAQQVKAIPVAQRFGLTTWNLTDGDTWLNNWYTPYRPTWPLPFDAAYQRKAAYDGLVEGFL